MLLKHHLEILFLQRLAIEIILLILYISIGIIFILLPTLQSIVIIIIIIITILKILELQFPTIIFMVIPGILLPCTSSGSLGQPFFFFNSIIVISIVRLPFKYWRILIVVEKLLLLMSYTPGGMDNSLFFSLILLLLINTTIIIKIGRFKRFIIMIIRFLIPFFLIFLLHL